MNFVVKILPDRYVSRSEFGPFYGKVRTVELASDAKMFSRKRDAYRRARVTGYKLRLIGDSREVVVEEFVLKK